VESLNIISCLNSDACKGGYEDICSKGYGGAMCAVCQGELDDGFYTKASKYSCQKCEDTSIIWLKIVGALIMIVAYVAILVAMIIFSASRS